MRAFKARLLLPLVLLLSLFLGLADLSAQVDVSSWSVKDILGKMDERGVSGLPDVEQRFLFMNRTEVHNLAATNAIPDAQFQSFQSFYDAKTESFASQVAKNEGLDFQRQQSLHPDDPFKVFTDGDFHVKGDNIDAATVAKLDANLEAKCTEYIRGLDGPDSMKLPEGYTFTMKEGRLDFLPTIESMTPEEGAKVRANIAERGGTPYLDPRAIEIEGKIRAAGGENPHLTPEEARIYKGEMDAQLGMRLEKIAENDAVIKAVRAGELTGSAADVRSIGLESVEHKALGAKYAVRSDQISAWAAEDKGVRYNSPLDPAVRTAAARGEGFTKAAKWFGDNADDVRSSLASAHDEVVRAPSRPVADGKGPGPAGQPPDGGGKPPGGGAPPEGGSPANSSAKAPAAAAAAAEPPAGNQGRSYVERVKAFDEKATKTVNDLDAAANKWVVDKANGAASYVANSSAGQYVSGKASAASGYLANTSVGKGVSNASGYLAETRLGKGASSAANAIRGNPEAVGKVLGVGGGIANGLDYTKIFINMVDTGDVKGAVKDAVVLTGKNVLIGLALAPVAAAAPVATAVVGGVAIVYGTIKTCGEIDAQTKSMASSINDEGQDTELAAATGKSLMDMIKRGYKLPDGMGFKEARDRVEWNRSHGKPPYDGVLDASRKGAPYDPMKPKDANNSPYAVAKTSPSGKDSGSSGGSQASASSKTGGQAPASGGSGGAASPSSAATAQPASGGGSATAPAKQLPSLRPGTASGRAEVVDSEIRNAVSGILTATDKSSINAGIEATGSGIFGSRLSSESSINVTASGKSSVNTGISANNSTIKDSTITNVVKGGKIEAVDGSAANAGVKAGNTVITGSTVTNTVTGTTTSAKKGSNVNQGIKFEEDKGK